MIVKRCLAKAPEERWQDIGDIAAAMQLLAGSVPRAVPNRLGSIAAAVLGLIAVVFMVAYLTRKTTESIVTRFSFAPPVKPDFTQLAISPDGRQVAFTAATANGGQTLWVRRIDSYNAEELPGTEGANGPFWSPDGRFIGFHTDVGDLKKINIGGGHGVVQTITLRAAARLPGAWNRDGVILFQPEQTGTGLSRVPASGGTPVPATRLNRGHQEISHRMPWFLPHGQHFLYWAWSASEEYTGIYVGSLNPEEKLPDVPLVRAWRQGVYTEPGYLLFLKGATLMAQRFDPAAIRLIGEPHNLPEHVSRFKNFTGSAVFSASSNGTLAYQAEVNVSGGRVSLRERSGKQIRAINLPAYSIFNSLSPDEKWLAGEEENEHSVENVWVIDLARGISSRLTSSSASDSNPIWSPDGRRIAFASNRSGVYDLYVKNADGTDGAGPLVKSEHTKFPSDWSSDGRFIICDESDAQTRSDLWILPVQQDRKPFPFLKTEFVETQGRFSPVSDNHGRFWVAYVSDETGRFEIYTRPFVPDALGGAAGARVRVSTAGGTSPNWRKDGRELFYLSLDKKLMAVDLRLGSKAEIGSEHQLFDLGSFEHTPRLRTAGDL